MLVHYLDNQIAWLEHTKWAKPNFEGQSAPPNREVCFIEYSLGCFGKRQHLHLCAWSGKSLYIRVLLVSISLLDINPQVDISHWIGVSSPWDPVVSAVDSLDYRAWRRDWSFEIWESQFYQKTTCVVARVSIWGKASNGKNNNTSFMHAAHWMDSNSGRGTRNVLS